MYEGKVLGLLSRGQGLRSHGLALQDRRPAPLSDRLGVLFTSLPERVSHDVWVVEERKGRRMRAGGGHG